MARCVVEVRKAESGLPGDAAFADEDRNHTRAVVVTVGRDKRSQTGVDCLRPNAEETEREDRRELHPT